MNENRFSTRITPRSAELNEIIAATNTAYRTNGNEKYSVNVSNIPTLCIKHAPLPLSSATAHSFIAANRRCGRLPELFGIATRNQSSQLFTVLGNGMTSRMLLMPVRYMMHLSKPRPKPA